MPIIIIRITVITLYLKTKFIVKAPPSVICKLGSVVEFDVLVTSYVLHFAFFIYHRRILSLSLKYYILATSQGSFSQSATYLVVRTLGVSTSPVVKPQQGDNRKSVHQSAGSKSPRLCILVKQHSSVSRSLFGYRRPVGDSGLASSIAIQGVLPTGSQWKAVRPGGTGLPAAGATV